MNDPGYEVVHDVLPSADVIVLAAALGTAWSGSRAGARHLMTHPAVAGVARHSRLLEIASRALGTDALPHRATLFDKSPGSNWLVVWHQDTALPLRERRETPGWGPWSTKRGVLYAHAPASALESIVALRVHLDDSLPANGPLRVLPGSHRLGVLSDEAIHDLARSSRPRECAAGRGAVVVMRPLLVHASSKAASAARRRVLHIEYARSMRLEGGLELAIA